MKPEAMFLPGTVNGGPGGVRHDRSGLSNRDALGVLVHGYL